MLLVTIVPRMFVSDGRSQWRGLGRRSLPEMFSCLPDRAAQPRGRADNIGSWRDAVPPNLPATRDGVSPLNERTRMQGRSLIHYLVLFFGVLAVASASIMIRMAQSSGMPATVIAAGRLGFAAIILLPIVLWRVGPELRAVRRQDLLLGVGAGAFLAVHFLTWISSLEYTS